MELTSSICLTPIPLAGVRPLELGLCCSLLLFIGELCTPAALNPTLLCRLWRASSFLSRSLSCSKLAPDPPRAPRPCVERDGSSADEPSLLELCGVVLVSLLELDPGRVLLDPWLLSSMLGEDLVLVDERRSEAELFSTVFDFVEAGECDAIMWSPGISALDSVVEVWDAVKEVPSGGGR